MARLTEPEIFAQLVESLRIAAECADALAINDVKGRDYFVLRENLKLVEGCCVQAMYWREDTRWSQLGMMAAECHKRAGNWLRPQRIIGSTSKTILAPKDRNEMFVKLALNLREFMKGVMSLKDTRTGRVGMILPIAQPIGRQIGAPVHITMPERIRRQGGLVVPKTVN